MKISKNVRIEMTKYLMVISIKIQVSIKSQINNRANTDCRIYWRLDQVPRINGKAIVNGEIVNGEIVAEGFTLGRYHSSYQKVPTETNQNNSSSDALINYSTIQPTIDRGSCCWDVDTVLYCLGRAALVEGLTLGRYHASHQLAPTQTHHSSQHYTAGVLGVLSPCSAERG
jgi:hypothetical protein